MQQNSSEQKEMTAREEESRVQEMYHSKRTINQLPD